MLPMLSISTPPDGENKMARIVPNTVSAVPMYILRVISFPSKTAPKMTLVTNWIDSRLASSDCGARL